MSYLNLNHLYYFYTIAIEGSIRDACKKLSLTQSTLSNQLKELELCLGESLFSREAKGLKLNETGKKVLTYASDIFRLRDDLVLSMKNQSDETGQVVKIGFMPCFVKKDIYHVFRSIWGDSQVQIKSKQDSLTNLIDDLSSKTIDVILSDRPILHMSHKLKNRELGKKQLSFVGHKKFSYLAANFPHSLNSVPYCAYAEGSSTQQAIDKYFRSNSISPNIIGEIDDVALLKFFAEDGQGVVAIPADLVEESITAQKLFHLGSSPDLQVSLWAINLFDCKLDDYLRKCIDDLLDHKMVMGALV